MGNCSGRPGGATTGDHSLRHQLWRQPPAATNIAAVTVHLVGGFLGSGKTTAIRSVCELLRQRGEEASVITNDQGTLLVDTAFLQRSHPTRDVTGGCFCCRYDQLVELLAGSAATARGTCSPRR